MYSFRVCRIIMLNFKDDEISTSGNRLHRFILYQNHKICNTPAIFSLCIALFAVAAPQYLMICLVLSKSYRIK